MPERLALTVGYSPGSLRGLCTSFRLLARIDNRWRLGNEERGRVIALCRLPRPLGALWSKQIASDRL